MNKSRIARCLACFILLSAALTTLLGSPIVVAAEEGSNSPAPPPSQGEPEKDYEPIGIVCKFPIVKGVAGDTFDFEFYLAPTVKEYAVAYDFSVIAPPGWEATIWHSYSEQRVGGIDLEGVIAPSETITVRAAPLPGKAPEPGEYVITFEMESRDTKISIDLTAVVTERYELNIDTTTGRFNTEIKGGEEKHISILLENTGTAAIEGLAFSSNKPEGWSVTFSPEKIDTLEPGLKQEVEVVIKSPKRTIARDYFATLKAESENASGSTQLRVTVLTPRIWGGGGIGIAVAVIAGLIVLFRRLSTR